MRGRLALGAAAAISAAAALLLGGALRDDASRPRPAGPNPAVAVSRLQDGFGAGDTQSLVSALQATLRDRPDARTWTLLGLAYQQRARETADSTYLTRSEEALRRGLVLAPRDAAATSALGSLALARHEFREALRLGRRAVRLAPATARNYGVVGDALVELGRYEEAFGAFERMNALKPNLASYARIAYARELLGRPREAILAMELALDAAGGQPEPAAWTHVELGKLHFGLGELAAAERHFRAALEVFPGYVSALDALARVEAANGNYGRAVELARRAVETVPLPQLVATLSDLYHATGRGALAREQDAVVAAVDRILVANGVRTELETALFDVDRGHRLRDALARARAAHRERPSIQADDVLAWTLARNGRCGEALAFSQRSLRLGTRDAGLFFHRGMIERCLGRDEVATSWFRRALDTNPHFSLRWAPVVRRYAS